MQEHHNVAVHGVNGDDGGDEGGGHDGDDEPSDSDSEHSDSSDENDSSSDDDDNDSDGDERGVLPPIGYADSSSSDESEVACHTR